MSDALRRTLRTGLQVLVGLAVALPSLVHTADLPSTLPGLGIALAVAAAVTRAMSSPLVDGLLPSWLRSTAPKAELPPINEAPVAKAEVAPAPVQPVTPVPPAASEAK